MPDRYIVCVLANDARNDLVKYTELGPNSKKRIEDALVWVSRELTGCKVTWVFGAGRNSQYRFGPTLAHLQGKYFRKISSFTGVWPDVRVNLYQPNYFGSLEEVDWVIKKAQEDFPYEDLCFVFCTQTGHANRLSCIMEMFYPQEEKIVVVTGHVGKRLYPWSLTEVRSYIKLAMIHFGWAKRRWQVA